MNEFGIAFDDRIPLDRFQGAEIEALLVNSITITLQLTEGRQIHLDYQGCVEHRNDWICGLPLCGETSLMSLVGQTIAVDFLSADHAVIHLSAGGSIELVRDVPGEDLVRFCTGEEQYQA